MYSFFISPHVSGENYKSLNLLLKPFNEGHCQCGVTNFKCFLFSFTCKALRDSIIQGILVGPFHLSKMGGGVSS